MKKAIVFGGTTEGRQLAEKLNLAKIAVVYCVATEYGKDMVLGDSGIDVRVGRLDGNQMRGLFEAENPDVIVDATHPFAEIVKKEIDSAVFSYKDTSFIRVCRDADEVDYTDCAFFEDVDSCEKALESTSGTIFLTTGSKELSAFCKNEALKERLVVRVIPSIESIKICMDNGLTGKQIIAMQGPFSKAMNRIQLKETNAKIMVLKSSGKSSGEAERINAAKEEGVQCFIIRRPVDSSEGLSVEDAIKKLEEVLQVSLKPNAFSEITPDVKCHITLAGFGMGFGSITEEVKETIQNADIIFGAARMLSSIECKGKKYPYYLAKDIMPVLNERIEALPYGILNALVLFSGDTGFYSGTKKLRDALKADGRIKVTVMPGISSVSALASCIGESYDDAVVMSCHGIEESVWQPKLIDATLHNAKVFTLTSGGKDVRIIGEILCKLEEDYGVKYEIVAGVNLYSYEKIVTLSAMKCATFPEDGLVVLMIKNKKPTTRRLSPGLSDDAFLRNKTPMSKEEIRALSICKLGLTENAVVYDIGGGSGSVSVEIGLLHPSINVYTVEFKEEACKLIRANINKFNLRNVKLYGGVAPEVLENLPAPTHVFIGGSGGRLEEILRTIKAKGNNTRVVINAVTLETIAEVNGILKNFAISDADVVQVAISKAKTIGDYNVMQAQNPVYVVSFYL